jgi:hypothetical protein
MTNMPTFQTVVIPGHSGLKLGFQILPELLDWAA